VSHTLFADDLALFDVSLVRMQRLMDRLHAYAVRKGMVVNVRKCATVVFSPKTYEGPPVLYHGAPIPNVEEFKYLGTVFTRSLNMGHAASQCVGSLMKAWRVVVWDAKSRGIAGMPHVMLRLLQTYVLPRALFGCQLWGPDLVARGDDHTSQSQRSLLAFYKRVLGVRRNVPSDSVVDEVGAEPLQHYWFKACVKFWSTAVQASEHNALLHSVLCHELELGRVDGRSWSGKMRKVLVEVLKVECDGRGVGVWVEEAVAVGVASVLLGEAGVPCMLDKSLVTRWDEALWARRCRRVLGEPSGDGGVPHRVQATYMACFWLERDAKGKRRLPPYLHAGHGLPREVVKSMARFRLSSHHLRVELARQMFPRLEYEHRTCMRCAALGVELPEVDNEEHVLGSCLATADLRAMPRFARLPVEDLVELMKHEDFKSVALFVHKCTLVVDADRLAAA
jgi:hypothetical protein